MGFEDLRTETAVLLVMMAVMTVMKVIAAMAMMMIVLLMNSSMIPNRCRISIFALCRVRDVNHLAQVQY